jgi:hypothetical protein
MYHEETPTWILFLKAFGEIVKIKNPCKLQAKLQNRGKPGIYLDPAQNYHKGDCYSFWNPITKYINESVQQFSYNKPMLLFKS